MVLPETSLKVEPEAIPSITGRFCFKKKYTNAKFSQLDGHTLLSMSLGYIYCEIYNMNLSRNFGGGTYIKLRYVDKKNTSDYSLPRLNKADDDL